MRLFLVFGLVGRLLRLFAWTFVLPIIFALFETEWMAALHFSIALVATLGFGLLFSRGFQLSAHLHRAEALAVVALTWLGIALFGAMPYTMEGLTFVDAMFESMSGFTTTGATILEDFALHHRPFYLWRSMTQWFGGLGVIALFVVVLPRLGIAGRQLFFAEASGAPGEAVSPQIRHASARLWILYAALTVILTSLLIWGGMGPFDAVCHAFTTLAAGGFSPNPASIAGFANPTVEWILIVFMILAGTSFPLIWTVVSRRPLEFFRDGEFLFYVGSAIVLGVAVAAVISGGLPDIDAVRAGLFQSASLISSTGYASVDYALWSPAALALLVVVMVIGGCAGSAAGGPKSVRHVLVIKHVWRDLSRALHPRAVIPIRYKGRPVNDAAMRTVFTVVVLYLGGYFAFGVILVLLGSDLVTGFSASIACFGNIGPAFGEAGPMGNFAAFSDTAKVVLTIEMWLGRLEIVTVLALLHPHVLRNIRLSTGR